MTDEINFVLQARREKLEALEAVGVAPYAYSFDRQHSASEAQALLGKGEEEPAVRLSPQMPRFPHNPKSPGHPERSGSFA